MIFNRLSANNSYCNEIKHIRAKPSALSQNLNQLLARMRRCVRVILSYSRARALGVVASSKVLPISLQFEHCVLRELMRTSILLRDNLRNRRYRHPHQRANPHGNCAIVFLARTTLRILPRYTQCSKGSAIGSIELPRASRARHVKHHAS